MFASRANLLQWLGAEMKGVNLEKFKGSFPHCQPPLLFCLCLLYLPVSLPDNFLHSVHTILYFYSFFYSPYCLTVYLSFFLFLSSADVSLAVGHLEGDEIRTGS